VVVVALEGRAVTAERWHQITEIFHAALALEAAKRQAFLASRCVGDSSLRREVEAMLGAHQQDSGFGEPAAVLPTPLDAPSSGSGVTLVAGTRVGPYEIVSLLDVGGMGAVYRARDSRLRRDVAVKVLLPAVVGDADRLARFAREARVLASLNHPHIAQVFGLEESNGVQALVMELVEGPTLADRVARGPLPLEEALRIAHQIAEALEAAHEQHIVHRDLKPANIKLRSDGTVKVLDFGLAKARDRAADGSEQNATMSSAGLSVPGLVLGTACYMAPEQAKGLPVDRRADLWAFGCVVFEMLTGRRAFTGDSVPDVLVHVIEHTPDWHRLPARTPSLIRRLLRRCLEKDPKRRLDSAAAARLEIEEARTTPAGDVSDPTAAARSQRVLRFVAAVALLSAAASIWLLLNRPVSVPRLQNAFQVTFGLDVESYPTWSPDGVRLAYQASHDGFFFIGNHDIWVTQVGIGEPVNLTEDSPANDRMPSWSPDGRQIAFSSDRDGEWGVYTVSAIGGIAQKVLPLPGVLSAAAISAPQWARDGAQFVVSVYQHGENVVITLSLQSRQTTRVRLPAHEGNVIRDLSVRPDGGRFAYVEGGGGGTEVTQLWTVSASGDEAVPLTDGFSDVRSPTWSADGSKVFYTSNRGGSMDLWQQEVSGRGTPVGEPLVVNAGLGIQSVAFSPDGKRLAYTRGRRVSNVWRVPILSDRPATWAEARPLTSERAFIEYLDLSPNGERLAVSSDRRGNQDLWLLPVAGGPMTPLTTDPTPDWHPSWSPKGDEIVFYAYRSGNRDIWAIPAGGGPARQITSHSTDEANPHWSLDGSKIVFLANRRDPPGTWIVDANGQNARFLTRGAAHWSRDPRWLVARIQERLVRIAADGSGETALPPTDHPPGWTRVSHDGQSIYYSVISGPREHHGFWKLSLGDGKNSRLTQLQGRPGNIGNAFATDDRYLYFTWREDEGDIWVMDVVERGGK
jgi:Tol biopolymer transport system component/serine/threonine protein kinase